MLAGLQIGLGVYLGARYAPTATGARAAVDALRSGGLGKFLAGFHYWGSFLLIAWSFAHVAVMLWNGKYRGADALKWIAGLTVFVAALGFQITGNLLPYDQHDVRTVAVEAGIASRVPLVGDNLRSLILSGREFSNATLSSWYLAHRILLPGLLVAGTAGVLIAHFRGRMGRVSWAGVAIPIVGAAAAGALLGTPTGTAASGLDASNFNAAASYYTWPLDGSLKLTERLIGQGWIGAILLPGLFTGFLFLLPMLSKRLSAGVVRGVFVGFLGYFAFAAIAFGGTFAPIVGNQDRKEPEATNVPNKVAVDPVLVQRGKALFAAKPCSGCHGDNGMHGISGPTLQLRNMQRRGRAGLFTYITDPHKVNPSSTMPAFKDQLTADEIKDIAEFLLSDR